MKIFRKIKLYYASYKLGGKINRNEARIIRRKNIYDLKTSILKDIRSGHNVGDFRIDDSDITSVLSYNIKTPISNIMSLYKKYRG